MLRDRDLVPTPQKKRSRKNVIFNILLGILCAWGARMAVHAWLLLPVKNNTDQMAPAVKRGETVYFYRRVGIAEIKRGDILLLRHPHAADLHMVRRVIAVGGESVRISDGLLFVNDRVVDAPWEKKIRRAQSKRNFSLPWSVFPEKNVAALKVKEGRFYVLADNRALGIDSRHLGPFTANMIIGKAVFND